MSTNKAIVALALGLFFTIGLVVGGYLFMQNQALGSVVTGSEYGVKMLSSSNVGTSSIKSLPATIGSIVVASTSPVATVGPLLAFYDTASTTIATTSMTAKMTFSANGAVTPTAGTYTYDVAFGSGVYLWVSPAFNGSYAITYR